MADLEELVIAPKTDTGKGRAFRALKVRAVMANSLWEYGSADKHDRPVLATFAASEGEIRPFVTNLLCGRPAVPTTKSYRRKGEGSGYEFMKSVGYRTFYQRYDEGVLATVYQPDIVALDLGMVDPKAIKLVLAPGEQYLRNEAKKIPVTEVVNYARCLPLVVEQNQPEKDWRGHVLDGWQKPLSDELLAEWVPLAYLFVLHLSNRSRAPIPPDGKFYMQFFLACLAKGLASFALNENDRHRHDSGFGRNKTYGFSEEGSGGYAPGIAFMADHVQVESLLAAECETYFARVEGK